MANDAAPPVAPAAAAATPAAAAPPAAPAAAAPAATPAVATPAAAATPAATPAAATPTAAQQTFIDSMPATWRDDIVRSQQLNESQANVLGRYQTFPDVIKAFFSQHDFIRTRQANELPTLPEKPTPEQLKEFRTKMGIPEKPEDYKVTVEQGITFGAEDGRIMQEVYKAAHAANIKPQVVQQLATAMLKAREVELQALMTKHEQDKQQGTQIMRQTWGSDFQTNRNMVGALINLLPANVKPLFEGSQLQDGKMLLNSPEVLMWLCDIARQLNPAGVVVPNSQNPMQDIDTEIKGIEDRMKNDREAYYKDEKAQARYRELLVARDSLSKRSK